jgi:hypothetical protein
MVAGSGTEALKLKVIERLKESQREVKQHLSRLPADVARG